MTATVKTKLVTGEIPTKSGEAEMMTVTATEDKARETMIEDVQNAIVAQAQTDTDVDLKTSRKNLK